MRGWRRVGLRFDSKRNREAEISSLTARVLGRKKDSVRTQIRDLRKFVLASVGDLRALLSDDDNAAATRMELAKHVKKIVLSPGVEDEIEYTGKWDLLGDGGNMDGAEGPIRSVSPLLEYSLPFEGVLGKAA